MSETRYQTEKPTAVASVVTNTWWKNISILFRSRKHAGRRDEPTQLAASLPAQYKDRADNVVCIQSPNNFSNWG